MLILSLHDLPQKNRGAQRSQDMEFGRDSCIVWGRARRIEVDPCRHGLSIRAAWGGAEYCHVDGRTIAVDDDNFLILNQGRVYATSICSERPVESLAIHFGGDLVQQMSQYVEGPLGTLSVVGRSWAHRGAQFFENLQPHESTVSPILRYIRLHLAQGVTDAAWYEEQLPVLFARMCTYHRAMLHEVDHLALARRPTRREVYRRIGLATDYLHTNYAQELELDALASVACLSKYHFLRLFTLVHGITPRAYLQRKRVKVATRLLETTELTVSEIATNVGFADASTLLRHVRRSTAFTPQQIRTGLKRTSAA